MARINFDDSAEDRPEFRRLVRLFNGDDDRARGILIRFWKTAQILWGEGRLVPQELMDRGEWQPLIDTGWARPMNVGDTLKGGTTIQVGGYYAIGSEEYFAWYVAHLRASQAGGRARSAGPRDELGRLVGKPSRGVEEIQPDASRPPAAASLKDTDKDNKTNTTSASATTERFDLEALYAKYPRKEGRSKGMEKLRKQIKTRKDYDDCERALAIYCRSETVLKGFIKTFATWVNSWRDCLESGYGKTTLPGMGPAITKRPKVRFAEVSPGVFAPTTEDAPEDAEEPL